MDVSFFALKPCILPKQSLLFPQVAGLLYRSNLYKIQSILQIPSFITSLVNKILGPLVASTVPKDEVPPMGATLELQRQQHIEQLEQQMAWAQLQPRPPEGVSMHIDLISSFIVWLVFVGCVSVWIGFDALVTVCIDFVVILTETPSGEIIHTI